MPASELVNLSGLLDDAKCFALVRQHRWPEGVRCPGCGRDTVIRDGCDDTQPHRQRYRCKACAGRFDDLTGTALAGHHQPLRVWVLCLSTCSGLVPTAKTTLNPAHVRPERRALHNEPRLDDDTIRLVEHGPETLRRLKLGCVARQMEQPDPVWNAKIRFGVPAGLVQHEHDATLAAG